MQLKPVEEQVVVIVGASSGIGRETARQFAQRGAKVMLTARDKGALKALQVEIINNGGLASYQVADVTRFEEVKQVAEATVEEFGHLDTWVHLAAVSLYATFEETKLKEFRRVIDVNLMGQIHGAMAALPHLRQEGRGALIHISSVESQVSLPYQSAYAASKHGMTGFLDALRLELQHEGVPISVTNIIPAGINTPLFTHALTRLGVQPQPMPPAYEPEVVANLIVHAAEHPSRDLIAGGAGKAMLLTQRISPQLMDKILLKAGFAGQQTDKPRGEQSDNNLDAPQPGAEQTHGNFPAKAFSFYTWLETHPPAARLLKTAVLGGLGFTLLRGLWEHQRRQNEVYRYYREHFGC